VLSVAQRPAGGIRGPTGVALLAGQTRSVRCGPRLRRGRGRTRAPVARSGAANRC